MNASIEEAMQVANLGRPELVLVCTALIRKGLAAGAVDAINKLAEGTLTAEMANATNVESISEEEWDE